MTDQEKYYTPDISEFHVGFEYESYEMYYTIVDEWDTGTLMWVKRTVLDINQEQFTGEGHKFKAIYHVSVNNLYEPNVEWNKNIRVKYLDREDIESLEWVKIQKKRASHFWDYYEKNGYEISIHKEKPTSISIDNGGDHEYLNTYFDGVIKNKSELKKIMQQIGIK